jgi:hypothetical protein
MWLTRSLGNSIFRWTLVFVGATLGSYAGRVAATAVRGEPVEPLLWFDRSMLMRPDAVPGFLAVELIGKLLRLGPWSSALVAAAAAAAAAFVEGPLVRPDAEQHATQEEAAELGPAAPASVS